MVEKIEHRKAKPSFERGNDCGYDGLRLWRQSNLNCASTDRGHNRCVDA